MNNKQKAELIARAKARSGRQIAIKMIGTFRAERTLLLALADPTEAQRRRLKDLNEQRAALLNYGGEDL